jgi:hypothetical protein
MLSSTTCTGMANERAEDSRRSETTLMPLFRGFVLSIEVRSDGWVETVIEAVHAGNALGTFFIPNLDGDLRSPIKDWDT